MIRLICLFICFLIIPPSYADNEEVDAASQQHEIIRKIEKEIIPLPSCDDKKLIEQTREFVIEYYTKNISQNVFDRRRKHFVIKNIDKFAQENIANYKTEKQRPVSDVLINLKINKGIIDENLKLCKNNSKNKEASDVYLIIHPENTGYRVHIVNLKLDYNVEEDVSFVYQ